MEKLKIKANAKINLTLGITGKRTDGYHTIDTVMQSIDLFDSITINKSNTISVKCNVCDICNENNIAFRAAELFFKEAKICGGAEIIIEKNIPTSAGLGGGSADAAAVLLGLNKLYEAEMLYETLCRLALSLGADVPFFIKGGTQRATGIGEVLSKQETLKVGCFLLVKTEEKPSTAEMYKRLDAKEKILPNTELALKAIADNDIKGLSAVLKNSFTAVWDKSVGRDALEQTDALGVSLSGSGPVWFGVYENIDTAKKAFNKLKELKIDCWLACPCESGVIKAEN